MDILLNDPLIDLGLISCNELGFKYKNTKGRYYIYIEENEAGSFVSVPFNLVKKALGLGYKIGVVLKSGGNYYKWHYDAKNILINYNMFETCNGDIWIKRRDFIEVK